MNPSESEIKFVKVKIKYLRPGDLVYSEYTQRILLVLDVFTSDSAGQTKIQLFHDNKKSLRFIDSHKTWNKVIYDDG